MKKNRVTIYDIATALNITGSYVSRALNDHPTISDKVKKLVKDKAAEMNYKHNSFAANLRRGRSKIIGVLVPKINEIFFSNVIAGIEEVCAKNDHHIIICQSEEKFKKEQEAIDTLINQNVDCIMISISQETTTAEHLQEILNNDIKLIQFDRFDDSILSFIIKNDNEEAAFNTVTHLVNKGYKKIAYIGGPEHLTIFKDRKQGYITAIRKAELSIPYDFTTNITLSREQSKEIALKLLKSKDKPDAFFTASDLAALGALQAARELSINVPSELAIIGFQNEEFGNFVSPSLSTVDQQSKQIGISAANTYFQKITKAKDKKGYNTEIIPCKLILRESSK